MFIKNCHGAGQVGRYVSGKILLHSSLDGVGSNFNKYGNLIKPGSIVGILTVLLVFKILPSNFRSVGKKEKISIC